MLPDKLQRPYDSSKFSCIIHFDQENPTYCPSGVRVAANKHEMICRFNSDNPQSGYKM
jgi:hypothetical protein